MKNKSPGFHFYPEKFIAGTRHLSETDRSIYMDMMCNIWTLTASQVDFPDTIPMWMTLTGLNDRERVEKIRERMMIPGMEMFAKKQTKKGIFLVQKGMRKEKLKQRKGNAQNSLNAISGWEKRRYENAAARVPQTDGKKSAMPSLSLSFSSSSSNLKKRARSFDVHEKTEKETAREKELAQIKGKLLVYLAENQIKSILKFMPDIPLQYVQEKVSIATQRKPENLGAFLYAAIMQNYQGNGEGKKETDPAWLKKALKRDLSIEEMRDVPASKRGQFKKIKIPQPPIREFELKSKPKETANAIEKRVFEQMEIGEKVGLEQINQMRELLRKHFKSSKTEQEDKVVYRMSKK